MKYVVDLLRYRLLDIFYGHTFHSLQLGVTVDTF